MRSSYSYTCLKTLGTKFPVFARYIDEISSKLKFLIHATIDHTNKEKVSTKRDGFIISNIYSSCDSESTNLGNNFGFL